MRKPAQAVDLGEDAVATLYAALDKPLGKCVLTPLLQLIAEVLDLAAGGEDIFVTIGTTRNKSALVVTVCWDGTKMFAAAGSAADLATNVLTLLSNP